MTSKPRSSRTMCCVPGCHNTYSNSDADVKFYDFPGRPHEIERRQTWIRFVKKINGDGSTWEPKKRSKLCSKHFINNVKHNHPLHPSFNPTIFSQTNVSPKIEKQNEAKINRYERLTKRKQTITTSTISTKISKTNSPINMNLNTSNSKIKKNVNFACQVNMDIETREESFLFTTEFYQNDVACQVNISRNNRTSKSSFADKCIGSNDVGLAFCGFKSVKTEKELKSLCGVTFNRFSLLFSLLLNNHGNSKLSLENKLLLFLMKIKLGLSYRALAIIFDIHFSSVSRIFLSLLYTLVQETKRYVYWPTRDIINKTMPAAFIRNFPACRIILDCAEINVCDVKNTEQRLLMYSHYKGTFTSKCLVGLSPNGFITFISHCYGGRSSDAYIMDDSGIFNLLEDEDQVIVNKGIPGINCKDGVVIVKPVVEDSKTSTDEIEATNTTDNVWMHVERYIQWINVYHILNNISTDLLTHLDEIVFICAVLTNLKHPIMNQVQD